MKKIILTLAMAGSALAQTPATQTPATQTPAAQTPATQMNRPVLALYIVKTMDGKEVVTPAGDKVLPGDLVERRLSVTVDKVTNGARLTMPIDRLYTYQAGSASITINGKPVEMKNRATYSIVEKGARNTYSLQPMKTVEVTENGSKVMKSVPAEPQDYRGVAYEIGNLKAGDSVLIKDRVRLR